jgi:hypothetical protein
MVRMGQQSQIQQNLKLRFVLENKNSMLYHLHTGDKETNNTVFVTYHQWKFKYIKAMNSIQ